MSSIISRSTRRRPICLQQPPSTVIIRQWPRYIRLFPIDDRIRHSQFWAPTFIANLDASEASKTEQGTKGKNLLIENGFIQQPVRRAGIYHYLPLGLRVLERLEKLLDKHMRSLGASKLALSSISHEAVWQKSGRLEGNLANGGHEILGVSDRKSSGLMLSPTHEEEIVNTAKHYIQTTRNSLPLRLYQTTRKYRDELRPRGGLLRTKEFIMKDMYSFDYGANEATETYNSVRQAYNNFFTEIGVPFLVAEADSGSMGGNLSHEYHYKSPLGEDTVWTCSNCDYTANDEVASKKVDLDTPYDGDGIKEWRGISINRTANITFYYPSKDTTSSYGSLKDLDVATIKSIYPGLDTSISDLSVDSPPMRQQIVVKHPLLSTDKLANFIRDHPHDHLTVTTGIHTDRDFLGVEENDPCPRCDSGKLTPHRTIEVGHTFFLGDRYTAPFNVTTKLPDLDKRITRVHVQMGCYGIGVSRLVGAIAEIGAGPIQSGRKQIDALTWPRPLAPFDVVIVMDSGNEETEAEAIKLYDHLTRYPSKRLLPPLEVILDDRNQTLPHKLIDADLRGIPIVVVFGKRYTKDGYIEIQCRELGQQCHVREIDAKTKIHAALNWLDKNYQKPAPESWPLLESEQVGLPPSLFKLKRRRSHKLPKEP